MLVQRTRHAFDGSPEHLVWCPSPRVSGERVAQPGEGAYGYAKSIK
jgi:hypothetical protein